MTKNFLALIIGFTSVSSLFSQEMKPLPATLQRLKAENVFPADGDKNFVFTDKNRDVNPSRFSAAVQKNGLLIMRAEVFAATPSPYNVQVNWKNTLAVKKGDVMLARLTIRCIYAKQESGDAVVNFYFQQAVMPFEKSILMEISAGPEWKTLEIPFKASHDMKRGEAAIALNFGALAQKVEIANLQVFNFRNNASIAQMPTTLLTYAGRESGAEWRNKALKRIEDIRTAPLNIRVIDAVGKPVNGASVQAKLVDPEFIFATALNSSYIASSEPDAMRYKKYLLELFNAGTIENGMKWQPWKDPKSRETTKKAFAWMLDNNLRIRGHNLVWPGKKFTPDFFSRQPEFGPGFRDSIKAHIKEIASFAKGNVYGWDVINEMMHETDYFKFMPRSEAIEWFKLAREADPKATLFINEYAMLNNVASPKNIKEYLDLIASLRNEGAPIDAIGVQGHVGRQPRNPVQVLADLDMFLPTGLPVQITEFDINTPDEQLQADYTRDFLIACYSHPSVNGFTMWGFWQKAHWKPDAAMYRTDWSPKPNLAVWKDLVLHQWRTNVSLTTKLDGSVSSRGHFGRYEITVTRGALSKTIVYQLSKYADPVIVRF